MSISPVCSVNSPYQYSGQGLASSVDTSLKNLGSALQSGSLSSAQQAYSTVVSTLQTAKTAATAAGYSGQGGPFLSLLKQGLGQVGLDLKSGNLSAASTAFSQMQQQLKTEMPPASWQNGASGHHRDPIAIPAAAASSVSSLANTGTSINTTA